MTTARPDWYPDPSNAALERWWNGRAWSIQTRGAAWATTPADFPYAGERALVDAGSSTRAPIWMGEQRAS